jgi:hypothetical protein
MTETEWLVCDDQRKMLDYVELTASARKLQLFALACCQRVAHLLNDDCRCLLEKLETREHFSAPVHEQDRLIAIAATYADVASSPISEPEHAATWQATEAVSMCAQGVYGSAAHFALYAMSSYRHGIWDDDADEAQAQALLLRDIFGNPFRPVALDPACLTSDVVALARGIYDDRAFDRMPILADALQDAGCAHEDILTHCRDAKQTHVRGCWVLDLLLGNDVTPLTAR